MKITELPIAPQWLLDAATNNADVDYDSDANYICSAIGLHSTIQESTKWIAVL